VLAHRDLPINQRIATAWLPDFGSRTGAIALSSDVTQKLKPELVGHWCSTLFDIYEAYDRQQFIETLNDWGWYGAGCPPHWFAGNAYP